jgi:hypothetical protein
VRARLIVVALVSMLLGARGVLAQADSCLRRSVPVNILNDQGQIVTGLTENNLIGSIHHQPVKILSVTQDDSPRRVVIVLDASGSMTGERSTWHLYLAVAHNLIAAMPSGTLAGLVVFGSKVDKNISLTSNKKQLEDELTILEPGTNALPKGLRQTALRDALAIAASGFDPLQGADAIYAITDGGDNASKLGEKSVREDLLNKRIRLFTLSVDIGGGGPTGPPGAAIGSMNLADLSNATGGYAVDLPRNAIGGPPTLANGSGEATPEGEALMLQFKQIFSFQRVQIQLPNALDKAQGWHLKVTGTKAKDLTVVYPHMLAGCSKPTQSATVTR